MCSYSQYGTERASLHAPSDRYRDTDEFYPAPSEQHWRSFIKSRMNIMQKNIDLVE